MKHRRRPVTHMAKLSSEKSPLLASCVVKEKNRGRQEERELKVYEPIESLAEFPSIKRVLSVNRIRVEKGERAEGKYWYVSSLASNDAEYFMKIIRDHWAIENGLHWVKDVILHEDRTKFHCKETTKKNVCYRNFTVTAIRKAGINSIKEGMEILANNPKKIWGMIRT
ncbi:MAG: ISAs1 family transposase [Bacteroidota bacterium]